MTIRSGLAGLCLGMVLLCGTPAVCSADGHTRLAVLASEGGRSEVRLIEVTSDERGLVLGGTTRAAAIVHAHDGVVRGAIAVGDGGEATALVTVEEDVGTDRSFAGALWRVELQGAPRARRLLGGLAYASKPVVAGRKVYLQTGRAGRSPSPRELREDEVEITELDLDRETTRVVWRMRGQLAYPIGVLAGVLGDELFAYLVGPPGTAGDGGRFAAISLSTLTHGGGAARDLGAVGIARDFSLVSGITGIDGGGMKRPGPAIVYEAREDHGRAVFVLGVDARGGGRPERLRRGRQPLAPLVTPSGNVYMSNDGLRVERAASASGLLVGQHHVGGEPLPRLHVTSSVSEVQIPSRAGERLEPIGFLEAP